MRFTIAVIAIAFGIVAGPALAGLPISARVLLGVAGVALALVGRWRYRRGSS